MDEILTDLILRCATYGGITLLIRALLRKPMVSSSLAFFSAWIFLFVGGMLALHNDWLYIQLYSLPYVNSMLNGAFIGFLATDLLPIKARVKSTPPAFMGYLEGWVDTYFHRALLVLFGVGAVFLAIRVSTVGLSMDYLSEVREVYNRRESNILNTIGSHLMVLVALFVIWRGLIDSYKGVDIRSLVLTICAAAPLGLANGGRIFLMSFSIAYLSSILVARSTNRREKWLLSGREAWSLAILMGVILLLFAVLGFLRGGYGHKLDILYTILIWPVSTLGALDDWVFSVLGAGPVHGIVSLGWIADFLGRIGIVDTSGVHQIFEGILSGFQYENNSAAVIPHTILPDLILDFGPNGVLVSMAFFAALLELASIYGATRGVFLHALATQAVVASFMTIQGSILTPGVSVLLIWAAIFSFALRRVRGRAAG